MDDNIVREIQESVDLKERDRRIVLFSNDSNIPSTEYQPFQPSDPRHQCPSDHIPLFVITLAAYRHDQTVIATADLRYPIELDNR